MVAPVLGKFSSVAERNDAIREAWNAQDRTAAAIGVEFGIGESTIINIARHLDGCVKRGSGRRVYEARHDLIRPHRKKTPSVKKPSPAERPAPGAASPHLAESTFIKPPSLARLMAGR